MLAGSGHIAGVVNPPAKPKYQYWTDGPPEGEFEDWIAKATEHPGSWWPYWFESIERQAPERVPAREPGGKLHAALRRARNVCVDEGVASFAASFVKSAGLRCRWPALFTDLNICARPLQPEWRLGGYPNGT